MSIWNAIGGSLAGLGGSRMPQMPGQSMPQGPQPRMPQVPGTGFEGSLPGHNPPKPFDPSQLPAALQGGTLASLGSPQGMWGGGQFDKSMLQSPQQMPPLLAGNGWQAQPAQPSLQDFERDYWAPDRDQVLAQMRASGGL